MKLKIHLASIAISTVGRCTLACKHCYENSSPATPGEFSIDQLRRFIDVSANAGIRHAFFAGGEPLLHPHVHEAVRHAVDSGMHPNLSTNGHLLTTEKLEQLYMAGLTHDLSVSIDGPTQEVNDRIRGRGSFVKTLQGMYVLNRYEKILWGANYVSCGLNFGQALETARLAKRLGASYFNLIRVTPFGRAASFKKPLLLSEKQYQDEVSKVRGEFRSFGNFFDDIVLFDLVGNLSDRATSYFDDPSFDSLPCGISVNHDGEVGLSPPRIDLGNCLNTDLGTLLERIESDEVQSLYRRWLRNEHQGIHQPPRTKILVD